MISPFSFSGASSISVIYFKLHLDPMTIYLVLSMLNINGYFNGTVSYAANENIEKSQKNIFHSPQVEDVSKILIF